MSRARATLPALDIAPCRRRSRPTASTAGCCTTSAASIRIATDVTGVGRQGGHLATRRWYYLIPATGEPRGLVHTIEKHSLAHLPGTTRDATPAAISSRRACGRLLDGHAARRDGILARLRDPLRRARRRRHDRAGAPVGRRTSSRPAISSSASRPSGTRDAIATHRQASEKLYRVKDRAFEAIARRLRDGVPTTEYDIQQLMAGWFRDEGLGQRLRPERVGRGERRQPALPADGDDAPRDSARTSCVLLDLWGKLDRPGAVFADITWMGYTGRAVPERFAKAFAAIRDARDAGVDARAAGDARRPRPARLGSRSRRVDGAARAPATATTSCTGPATASASRCTATASTWTTTKRTTIGVCCRAPASRSNPASTSTTSAFARKST